jgi:ubiquinone biosynthesis monooxygenase Coq6
VSSLTAENVAWLQSIGAWANIAKQRSCPVDDIIVWANPDKDATPMLHFPGGDGALAYMTENINTQRALLRTLSSSENVDVREGARVQEMRYGEGRGWVGLRIGSPDGKDKWVRGSLVVGADGPNSPARAFAGIDTFGRAYDAHGVVSTLSLRPDPVWGHNTAFQRFLPTGPLAFLPLSADNATMVWSTLPGHAAALKRLPADALAVAVNAAFALSESDLAGLMDAILASDAAGSPLSAETITGILAALPAPDTPPDAPLPPVVTGIDPRSVASFPLRLSHADAYTAHRVALVGDAAHTTHPLAGQGLNAGLADARVLADVLADARAVGSDLGSVTALAPYPRQRYLPNHVMLAAVDKLELVFGARNPLINWARGTGLEVLNELGPLKAFFMANAGSAGAGAARSDEDRTFGRARAADALPGRPTGLPAALADAAEAFQTASQVAAAAGGMLAEGLKNALRRGADALEKK